MKNFWRELPRPFFILAPLANVTDAAFRRIIAKYSKVAGGAPYVTYTEFVSADGLLRANEEGKAKLMRDLLFSDAERPIVAQFFTSDPEAMEHAAHLAAELGFDGVDINMGCPDRSVEAQGAGAKLIRSPERAKELIAAAKHGLARWSTAKGAPNLPVSVKTRLGYNTDVLDAWLPALLSAEPAAITLHARTRKEMSKVPARWERVARAVEIRDEIRSKTLIIGNGDLRDLADAQRKIAESGADGAMLGRAIFGRPWLFCEEPGGLSLPRQAPQPTNPQALRILVEHTKLFEELLGDVKNFAIMKKHFKAYIASPADGLRPREGFAGAKELRARLMEAENAGEVEKLVEDFLAGAYTGGI